MGTAPVSSPCGTEGGNPAGCVQADGHSLGRCTTDDGGFGFGSDGRLLGQLGVTTAWTVGSTVEVGWSLRSNHGGGYSYRLCKKPASGNFSDITEACFARMPLKFVGNTSFIQYNTETGGRSNPPLTPEKLLENTDLKSEYPIILGGLEHPISVLSRGGSLPPSIYADARYIDAVVVSQANGLKSMPSGRL